MNGYICPVCGSSVKCRKINYDIESFIPYHCDTYKSDFFIDEEIIKIPDGDEIKERLLNLIAEQLLSKPYCKNDKQLCDHKWHFSYIPNDQWNEIKSNYINLTERMNNYPNSVMSVANRALLNLSIAYPNYGDEIDFFLKHKRILFEHRENNAGTSGVLNLLQDLGYVKTSSRSNYIITSDGWKKIEDLKGRELLIKQAFVAMQFSDETKPIREAFRKAIEESNYNVRLIDEKEHNNQIVPEILFEIEQSKFMVVDITYPNYGAYYEAGYAQALKKEVIICCRKKEFEIKKPHFDIAQKSMIIWKDEEDLINRLKNRIRATVTK